MHEASVILHASLARGRALRSPVARPTVPIDRVRRAAPLVAPEPLPVEELPPVEPTPTMAPADLPTATMGWLRANTGAERRRKIGVVVTCVARLGDASQGDVIGRTRLKAFSSLRQVAMWILRHAGAGFAQLGRDFGRDHTTAINACRVVDAALGPRVFDDDALIADVAREVIAAMADRRRSKETER